VTFLGYSFFHISYPSDMRKLKAHMEAEAKAQTRAEAEVI